MTRLSLAAWKQLALRERSWVLFRQSKWSEIDPHYAVGFAMLKALQKADAHAPLTLAYAEATEDDTLQSGSVYGFWASELHWMISSPVGQSPYGSTENSAAESKLLDVNAVDKLLSRDLE